MSSTKPQDGKCDTESSMLEQLKVDSMSNQADIGCFRRYSWFSFSNVRASHSSSVPSSVHSSLKGLPAALTILSTCVTCAFRNTGQCARSSKRACNSHSTDHLLEVTAGGVKMERSQV